MIYWGDSQTKANITNETIVTNTLGIKTRGQRSSDEKGTPTAWVRREPEKTNVIWNTGKGKI